MSAVRVASRLVLEIAPDDREAGAVAQAAVACDVDAEAVWLDLITAHPNPAVRWWFAGQVDCPHVALWAARNDTDADVRHQAELSLALGANPGRRFQSTATTEGRR